MEVVVLVILLLLLFCPCLEIWYLEERLPIDLPVVVQGVLCLVVPLYAQLLEVLPLLFAPSNR